MKILKGLPQYFVSQGRQLDDPRPLYLMMNLESTCSYRCLQCAVAGPQVRCKIPMTLEQRRAIFVQMHQLGVRALVIIGDGEPTENFHRLLKPTIEAAHERGLLTILFTTASAIDRRQAEFYRDHDVSMYISLPTLDADQYTKLTGGGDLLEILINIIGLRAVFMPTVETHENTTVVRIGINSTVFRLNIDQIPKLRQFAGNDMHFVANSPMQRGRIDTGGIWDHLVGDSWAKLDSVSRTMSDTGGHTSETEGACSYFFQGIAVDTDGQLLICGYASDQTFGDTLKMSPEQILEHYQHKRTVFTGFRQEHPQVACPLRRKAYKPFIAKMKEEKE